MSTQPSVGDTQSAPTASRGRGRGGRGGGPAPRGKSTTGRAAPKAQTSKIGPTRLLEAEWVKDAVLKGDAFTLFAGSGVAGDQQWTFHRPIGETALNERDWVATPTRDLDFLLQRKESEALLSWKRQAELAKRQAVLASQMGRKLTTPTSKEEVWTFDGAPAIQPTIRMCMAAAKAAGKPESEWLSHAEPAVQVQEQRFKEALKSQAIPEAWVAEHPRPRHETRGGPLGDQPQRSVAYLHGLTTSAAKDKVIRVVIGVDSAVMGNAGQSSIVPTPTSAYSGGGDTVRPSMEGPTGVDNTSGVVRSKVAFRRMPVSNSGSSVENPPTTG